MKKLPLIVSFLLLATTLCAQDVIEPKSGVKFPSKNGEATLTGVALRTKTFLKVKVYAVGLYVADSALAGPLAAYKGKPKAAPFYKDLVWGDFPKEIHMNFVRDLSASQIQGAFRETLESAEKAKVDAFVSYFGDIKTGQDCVLRWAPGGTLEVSVAGAAKPAIADKNFAAAVFGIWLGEKPIQDDIKQDLVKSF
jgi:hypothetical protein